MNYRDARYFWESRKENHTWNKGRVCDWLAEELYDFWRTVYQYSSEDRSLLRSALDQCIAEYSGRPNRVERINESLAKLQQQEANLTLPEKEQTARKRIDKLKHKAELKRAYFARLDEECDYEEYDYEEDEDENDNKKNEDKRSFDEKFEEDLRLQIKLKKKEKQDNLSDSEPLQRTDDYILYAIPLILALPELQTTYTECQLIEIGKRLAEDYRQ